MVPAAAAVRPQLTGSGDGDLGRSRCPSHTMLPGSHTCTDWELKMSYCSH